MKKLSIFLVVCMLVSLFPAGLALAQETPAILRYEMEDSQHNGSAPQGGQNGATGANGGTVLFLGAGGEATLTVDGGLGGEKRIAVRASSGMANPTQISMAVNGGPSETKELWPTPGDWLIFRQVFFFANLNPGENTITLSIAGDGANFDNIEISNKGYLYDFEEAEETDPSASAYGHATFSGLGVTPMRASRATFSNVYTQTSGKKKLSITYACGEVGVTEMKITVNGTETPFQIQPETPLEWWALRTDSIYIQMEAGENNTIVVENVSEGAINADYLTIEDVDEEAEQALVRANVSGVPAFLSAGCSKAITAGDAYRANGEVADCEISYNADGEFLAFDEATGALTGLQNGVGSFEVTYTDTLNAQNTLTRQFKINVTNEGQPLFFEAEQMENNGVGLEAGRPLQPLDLGDRTIMMNLNPNGEGTQFYIRNYFSSEAKNIDVTLCFAANDFTFSMETKVNDGEYVPCGLTDTGSWTNYEEKTFQISVEAGFNDITFKGGNYNFDYVYLPGEKYTGGGLTGSDEIQTGATENYSLDAPEGFDAFYTIDSDKVTLTQNADGTASVTSLEKGHDITLTAAMRSSSCGAVETVTKQISTVNAPPAAKTGVSKRVEAKKQITVTAQDLATDADGDALTVTRVVSPGFTQDEAEITVQNGRLIIAGIALTEKKDVTVAVSDQTDETEVTLAVTILAEVINQPPVAKEIPNKNLYVGETYTLNAADLAADPEGETLMITAVSPQSDGVAFTDAQITVTAKEKGEKTYTATVSDGDKSTDVSFCVTTINSLPTAKGFEASIYSGKSKIISASDIAADIDGDSLSITDVVSVSTGDVTASIQEGGVQVRVNATLAEPATVTVLVSDGEAAAEITFTVTTPYKYTLIEAENLPTNNLGGNAAGGITIYEDLTASGGKYVGYISEDTEFYLNNIKSEKEKDLYLAIRMGAPADSAFTMTINGVSSTVNFPSTGSWYVFDVFVTPIHLNAGTNNITLKGGAYNVDYFRLYDDKTIANATISGPVTVGINETVTYTVQTTYVDQSVVPEEKMNVEWNINPLEVQVISRSQTQITVRHLTYGSTVIGATVTDLETDEMITGEKTVAVTDDIVLEAEDMLLSGGATIRSDGGPTFVVMLSTSTITAENISSAEGGRHLVTIDYQNGAGNTSIITLKIGERSYELELPSMGIETWTQWLKVSVPIDFDQGMSNTISIETPSSAVHIDKLTIGTKPYYQDVRIDNAVQMNPWDSGADIVVSGQKGEDRQTLAATEYEASVTDNGVCLLQNGKLIPVKAGVFTLKVSLLSQDTTVEKTIVVTGSNRFVLSSPAAVTDGDTLSVAAGSDVLWVAYQNSTQKTITITLTDGEKNYEAHLVPTGAVPGQVKAAEVSAPHEGTPAEPADEAVVLAAYFQDEFPINEVNNAKLSNLVPLFTQYKKALGLENADHADLDRVASDVYKKVHSGYQFADLAKLKAYIAELLDGYHKPNISNSGNGSSSTKKKPDIGAFTPDSATETQQTSFQDVPAAHWAYSAIMLLTEQNILKGYEDGRFLPENNITREEFVKIVVSAFGLYDKTAGSDFSDVEVGAWYYPYVASAYKLGIVKGQSENLFGVGQIITRQDMAVILYNVMAYKNITPEAKRDGAPFTDEADISDYAKNAVNTMYQAQLINGMGDGSFAPQSPATRAQAAVMIANIIQ